MQMTEQKPGGGSAPQKKGGAGKWLMAGCLVAALLLVACAVGLFIIAKGLGVGFYRDALTAMQKQTVVVEKLGEPLEYGSITSMTFPVTGPKGKGMVTVTGSKVGDEWKIESLTVTVEATKEVITVIGPEIPGTNKGKRK
jgi:hypothetical protein